MLKQSLFWSLYVIILTTVVNGDYDCVCNYAIEKAVYPDVAQIKQSLGYLYEFDCKPQAREHVQSGQQPVVAIQFEKQVGYITSVNTETQICAGNPKPADLIEAPSTPFDHTTTITTHTKTTPATASTTTTTAAITTPATTLPTTKSLHTTTTATTTSTTTTTTTTAKSTTTRPTTTTAKPTTTRPTTTTPMPTSTHITTATTTEPPTTPYAYWSMAANVLGTPYQYVGIGYNLLDANPDSDPDTGFLTSSRIFQLTGDASSNLLEATYQSTATCVPETHAFLIHGSKAYQDELMNYVSFANHTPSVTDDAFTYNINFKGRANKVNDANHVYNDVITTCRFGTVNYLYIRNDVNFTVTRDFASAVCNLPKSFTTGRQAYMTFLDTWGTSIVTSVDMGTKNIVRYQTTPADLVNHVKKLDPDFIRDGGAYAGYESSVAIETKKYQSSRAATSTVGSNHTISIGTKYHQVPITSHVIPISTALDIKYWKRIMDELVYEGFCPHSLYDTGLTQYANNIRTALSQYVTYKSTEQGFSQASLLDRPYVQVSITWPIGTYGLMKAAQGCPRSHAHWSEGWRKFDTEDDDGNNYFTQNVNMYLSGTFGSNNILSRFCMKIVSKTSQYDEQWPKGSFCLFKDGPCPAGFASGYIYWDNEDSSTSNGHGGTMPDGTYDDNTKIYFCCRNDGSTHDKIFLPTDKPFVLMRYSNVCQAVNGMSVTEVFVRWDDEDTLNSSGHGGMYPADSGGYKDHLLHFCYYKSTSGGIGNILVG